MEHIESFSIEPDEGYYVLVIETDERELPLRLMLTDGDEVAAAVRPILNGIAEREYERAAFGRASAEEREAVIHGHSFRVVDEELRDPEDMLDWADRRNKERKEA